MISQVTGVVLEKQAPAIVLDVNGIGYQLLVPMNNFDQLPDISERATLYTEFIVREDAQTLYGFVTQRDRQLFQILLKVNGVGAKMALGILSAMDADIFVCCIRDKDIPALMRLPGVGKKTAERLMIELFDRVKDWQLGDLAKGGDSPQMLARDLQEEASAALMSLGYRAQEVKKMIAGVSKLAEFKDSESLIRAALKAQAR